MNYNENDQKSIEIDKSLINKTDTIKENTKFNRANVFFFFSFWNNADSNYSKKNELL
jgi:hypothetical protein